MVFNSKKNHRRRKAWCRKKRYYDEIENLVNRSPNSEKEIRRFYKKPSNRQRIEDDMIEKKILEYLGQFAKIKEVEVNTKDIRGENK